MLTTTKGRNLKDDSKRAGQTRLHLLDKICSNVRSVKQHLPVFSSITQMARYALNASAATLILLDGEEDSLLYKYTDGPLGKQLKQLHLGKQLSITRWVISNGKPLLLKDINQEEDSGGARDEVAGVVPRSVICAPLLVKGEVTGAIEVLNKLDGNSFNEHDVRILTGLADNAALTIDNIKLNEDLLCSYKNAVQELVSSVDVRESTASKHSRRVAEYALVAANELSLPGEEKQAIEYAAILHDIGLLSIPQSIVNKSEKLTKEEWEMIRKHPVIGYNLLRGIPSLNQVSKLILYHHEWFDGKGYPCGLKGDTIPLGARIIAVADAFDSMTVKHSYRAAMLPKDALEEIGRCSGSQFCPTAARAFFKGYLRSYTTGRVKFKDISMV